VIPLAIPNVSGNEGRYLQACVDENFVSTVGRFVGEFETALCEATAFDHAVVTSQGTTALHLGLTALGVDVGDLVIIPDMTFIATANAVSHCKAKPWLLDISAQSWTLDTNLLRQALEEQCVRDGNTVRHRESGARVAAIMPVYTMGLAPDMDAICDIADEFGIPVIADGAAALGTTYKDKPLGGTRAALTMMSFNGNKIITSGGGGVLLSNDETLMAHVRHICSTARHGRGYDHDHVGFNYRMTNIQAAVGMGQIERIEEFVAAKRKIAAHYRDGIAGRNDIQPFVQAEWSDGNHWFSGVYLDGWAPERVDALRDHLRASGVDARPFWKPMSLQVPYADCPTLLSGVTASVWERILPLPCSTQITDAQLDQVVAALHTFDG
jgi:dTDP-4-amino-4,6-dideoxygalactose transaminase